MERSNAFVWRECARERARDVTRVARAGVKLFVQFGFKRASRRGGTSLSIACVDV
jgi:hypothetical protein